MRLVAFRSLAAVRGPLMCRVKAATAGGYDGVELSLAQLQLVPELLDLCHGEALRASICLAPADAADAEGMLERLASHLSGSSQAVELVTLRAPAGNSLSESLAYLEHVLPLTARFLEANPSVGASHGKLTGHGTPVPTHVLGACHELHGGVHALSELCDIFPPTRLSLQPSNLLQTLRPERPAEAAGVRAAADEAGAGAGSQLSPEAGLSDELDTVCLCTDHLLLTAWTPAARAISELAAVAPVYEEVWSAQQLDGAEETYATVRDVPDSNAPAEQDEAAAALLHELRQLFSDSEAWRAGGAERRAREAAEEARRGARRTLETGEVGEAASLFGLAIADGELCARVVKERWRELAMKSHPDTGGGADEFLALRRAYRTLLTAATKD